MNGLMNSMAPGGGGRPPCRAEAAAAPPPAQCPSWDSSFDSLLRLDGAAFGEDTSEMCLFNVKDGFLGEACCDACADAMPPGIG
jgi:hypothetical protein